MKTIRIFVNALFVILSLSIASCSSDDDNTVDDIVENEDNNNSGGGEVIIDTDFETNSQDIILENAITITFNKDSTITIVNPFENDGITISNTNSNVIVTSTNTTTEVNYILSGYTYTGSLKIYSDLKFGLVLNGVSIVSADGPAINIQSKKKNTITLVANTNNRLIDGLVYTANGTEDMKGTLFGEGQMIFEGSGNLLVGGRYSHAICSDDYIRVNSGNITISGAVKDGIHAADYFEMNGGLLDIASTSDAIDCDEGYIVINAGSIKINSVGDGIKTSYKSTDIARYITINGGTLDINVTGDASKGIKSKDAITIAGGTITVKTTGNAYYDTGDAEITSSCGVKADGNISISGTGTLTVTSSGKGGKGISADGTLTFDGCTTTVTTTGDQYVYGADDTAAKAIKSDGNLTVNSGTIKVSTSKTEAEGLESKATLVINGGTIEIEAYDDGINADNHIEITGGWVYVYSTVNDAIDSNGTLTISGGTVVAVGSTSPEAGFDCDNNTFKITGGTLIGVGGSTSTPTSSASTQRSIVYGSTSAYQLVHIESSTGTELITFKVPRTYSQSMTLLFSSPSMTNTSYTIYTGGSVSGGSNFHGLYTGATYTKGTSAATFTASNMVTTVGTSGGGGRP